MKTQELFAGRYRVEERIGAGGMGDVFRAIDTVLNREVALKLLRTDLARDERLRERFRREALTAASITHPAVAAVHDYVEGDGIPAIVMELVQGETLAERLRRGRLSPTEVTLIGAEACAALEAAHERGVVHRDIKPSNVMLVPPGGIKVMDFGIARAAAQTTLTDTGAVLGTPDYIAPEQVRGEPATPASDLYSLGAVLYESATGHRPFEADSSTATALARLTTDPTPPREWRPDLPSTLDEAIMRAMQREPRDRFGTASEMGAALVGEATPAPVIQPAPVATPASNPPTMVLEEGFAETELRPPPAARAAKPRRVKRIAAIAVLGLLAAGLVAWVATRGPAQVHVPSVVGLNQSAATAALTKAGLTVKVVKASSEEQPSGIVFAQDPARGKVLTRGSSVTIKVSTGPPLATVPLITDSTARDQIPSILQTAGLQLGTIVFEQHEDVEPGTLIGTNPAAGARVPRGTKVDIVIAVHGGGKGKGHD